MKPLLHRWLCAALWALTCGTPLHAAALAAAQPSAPASQGAQEDVPQGPVQRDLALEPAPTGPMTPSPITDHLAFSAIFFWGLASTTGRFDSNTGGGAAGAGTTGITGTPFSAEHDLGLSSQAHQALIELIIRLEQRNRLRFDFLDLRRSGEALLGGPLQFGTTLFPKAGPVQSELDWRETDFTYTYSFLRNDRFELGIGPALHLIQANASALEPGTAQRQAYSEAGPFATLALDGTWRIAPHWSLNARGQYLRLAINSDSGFLGDYHADLQYRVVSHLAVGAGYEYRRMQVDIRNANPSGFVQLNIDGPELFVRASL